MTDKDKQLQKANKYESPTKVNNDSNWEKAKKIDVDKKLVIQNKDGSKSIIARNAFDDKYLAKILDAKKNRDEKTAAITNYLVSNNLDNLAFLGELFRTKGNLTKETREFKSQVRFDFEMFVATFTTFLRDTAQSVWDILVDFNYSLEDSVLEYKKTKVFNAFDDEKDRALAMLCMSFYDQADSLEKVVKKITDQREKSKGKGIYIDKLGRAHSLYEENLFDIIKSEKDELIKKKKNDMP